MDLIRNLVSKNMIKIHDKEFNLDLAYILDSKIIAMSYPSSGFQSLYRNKFEDVVQFLEKHHQGDYKVFNLTGIKYKKDLFYEKHASVECIDFSRDHHSPLSETLIYSTSLAYKHIAATNRPNSVVVVHCMAGKGRTGTLICCLLYMMKVATSAEEAIEYYGWKRHKKHQGVNQPSQVRYVKYFEQMLKRNVQSSPIMILCSIVFHNVPTKLNPKITIEQNGKELVELSSSRYQIKTIDHKVVITFSNIPLMGDIDILFMNDLVRTVFMFRTSFNTSFITDNKIVFHKYELDPSEFRKSSLFNDASYLELNFQAYCFNDMDSNKTYENYCNQCKGFKVFQECVDKWEKINATIVTYEAMCNMTEFKIPNVDMFKRQITETSKLSAHSLYQKYFKDD